MNTFGKTVKFISFGVALFALLFAMPVKAATPSVLTTTATGITQTTATLNAAYSFTGASIDLRFEYGTTPLLGTYTAIETRTTQNGTFSVPITTAPNEQYYFRAIGVTTGQLPGSGSTLNFTTPTYQYPTVMTVAANNIGTTTVTLNGFFNGNGSSTSTKFEYANNNAFIGSTTTSFVAQASNGAFSANISGLTSGTTYFFRAIAKNSAGTIVATSILNFHTQAAQVPACTINTFSANPSTIANGGTSVLSWTTSNCTSTSISTIGAVTPVSSGSVTTSQLSNTTTYTLTATGANGTDTATTTVTVSNGGGNSCVINTFSANPNTITAGNSSTLSWTTSNCTNASISNIGTVVTNGNISTGGISNTTTYVLTVSGANGSDSSSETVTVSNGGGNSCVINSFYASPSSVNSGNSSTLYWSTSNCSSASITNLGSVSTNGSQGTGAIYGNTSYTLSANGSNGTVTSTTSVSIDNGGCSYGCVGGTPTATTSSAYGVTESSATLAGYVSGAVPSATVWFQYGTSGNGYFASTAYPSQSTIYGAQNVSTYISGLTANTTYFFRVCASNNYGQNCGNTMSFLTTGNTNPYYPPYNPQQPPIIIYTGGGTTSDVGEASLATLKLTAQSAEVVRGETISYSVSLQNVANRSLTNVSIRVAAPSDLPLVSTSEGNLDFISNSVTLKMTRLAIGETKTITITARARENTKADSFVVTADASYTNTRTGGTENAHAEVITVVRYNGFLASIFGSGVSVNLIGVLLAILIALVIFVIARRTVAYPAARPVPLPPSRLPL